MEIQAGLGWAEQTLHPNACTASAVLIACYLHRLSVTEKVGRYTKEGYKTKTGSTSSVTLNLTRFEYWDRAGGGRNMV